MHRFKKYFFFILLAAFSVSLTFAQSKDFVSPDGSFKIALPNDSVGSNEVSSSPSVKGGSEFSWKLPQGQFLVGYIDLSASPEEAKQKLQKSGDDLVKNITDYGGKLLTRKALLLDGNSGVEIKLQLPDEMVAITRFYLVKNRIYNLSTDWSAKEEGAAQLKILNSFQLITAKATKP